MDNEMTKYKRYLILKIDMFLHSLLFIYINIDLSFAETARGFIV